MFPLEQVIPDGSPWLDYKQATKSGPELLFTFRIENFLKFILKEICITFPCAVNGRSQLPIKVSANYSSSQNLFIPKPIPPELISSPSQNFRQGVLNEDAQGMRLHPAILFYPGDKGDTINVSVTGAPTALVIGCMITGRKYGGETWL